MHNWGEANRSAAHVVCMGDTAVAGLARSALMGDGSRSLKTRQPLAGRLRRRRAREAAACLAVALLAGCGGRSKPVPATRLPVLDIAQPSGTMNPPVIISGNPRRDTAAYLDSNDDLTESDWAALETLGPRPVWEQLEQRRRRAPRTATAIAWEPTHSRQTLSGLRPHAVILGPSSRPATAPTTVPATATPTTAPHAAPGDAPVGGANGATSSATATPFDESSLPLEVSELPDNRVRLIWVLRHYGGSGVKTSRDPNTSRRTVELSAPDLAPLVSVIVPCLGLGGTCTPLPRENTLIITCDRGQRANVVDLLARLDAPQRQVEIAAKIFEVSHDFDFQQGSELLLGRLAADGSQQLASTFSAKRFLDAMSTPAAAGQPVQGSVLRLVQTFSGAGITVDAAFQLLAEAGLIRVVSAPRMTVSVGQTGYMLAGQELPIQSANIVNNALQTLTSYKPVGVQLYITPQSAGADRIKLHTISIVSAVSGFAPLPTMNGTDKPRMLLNPVIDSREAETAVTIGDRDTLVISGLRMMRTTTRESKIPGLGDLPVVGTLFKNHRSQQQLTDLYFFLTPTILDDGPAMRPELALPAQPTVVQIPAE